MNGLELAKAYYLQCGKPMLEKRFPYCKDRIACGLAGEGSECLGFDDAYSQDHDFGPGFCMWLSDEDEAAAGDDLRAAYRELPREFAGFRTRDPFSYGEQRLSAMPASVFYRKFTSLPRQPQTLDEWRRIPEPFLAAAVSGEVFEDALGAFSAVRNALLAFYPEDIRLKKIAARAALMAQSGQYNYPRCMRRGESAAAFLALAEFVKAALSMAYLLNRRYMPFYKWAHRGLKNLSSAGELYGLFGLLCGSPKNPQELIEESCAVVLRELKKQNLVSGEGDFLLDHGREIMDKIGDAKIRNLHLMAE